MNNPGVALDHSAGFADRVRSALIWRWGSQVVAQLITWTATILVVRMLVPHDYGLFAMAQTVLTTLNFLNGYSFATSLIRDKEIDSRRVGQAFGLLLLANGALAVVQLAAAPLAAAYYEQPLLATMLRVQALIYLTTPFIALPSALLARQLDFRRQALINLCCAAIGGAVAVGLAKAGYGVWALVWAPITLFATRAVALTFAAKALVRPVFDFRGAGQMIGFGSALTLCQLMWIIQCQADIVIAGRIFNPHDLGLYSESLFLAAIFTGRFLPPLNEVAFPAYSELVNAGKPIGSVFLAGVRLIMLVATPFYVGLSLVAGPLVATFFGPKWLEMTPILSGLALAMPAMTLQIVCAPATNALGRPRIYVMSSIAGAVIMPLCYLWGVQFGAEGLVAAWQVAAPALLAVTLLLTLPAVGVSLLELTRALAPVGFACLTMALGVWEVGRHMPHLSPPFQLAVLTSVGMAVYFGAMTLLAPALLRDTWTRVVRRRPSEPAPIAF